jgi:polysaccharide pyruvyl transferase WcaK-like protein
VRILSIGDIGVLDGMLHIGDEAMFEAFLEAMRSRGLSDVTAVSANPEETSARYGIAAVPQVLVDEAAAIAAVRASDALVITGAGNLSSLWPQHIHERLALVRAATEAGIPIVVSGQTIGPHLTPEHANLVRELLGLASLVSVRETDSLHLCLDLGIDPALLTATVDDASFLVDTAADADAAAEAANATAAEPPPYCLVTIARHTGDSDPEQFIDALAALLDSIIAQTGLEIRFSAHFVSLTEEPRGDSLVHERVRARMRGVASVEEVRDAVASARLARGASLVVSSRYHPAVFAVSGGVPTIGIPVDDYTTTKLRGALGNFGQHSILRAQSLLAGEGPSLVAEVWAAAATIRANSQEIAVVRRQQSASWWDLVAQTIGSPPPDA